MTDIFLTAGQANADIVLSDPTVQPGGGDGQAFPAGLAMAIALGAVLLAGDAAIGVAGVSSTASVGTGTDTGGGIVFPLGVEMVSALGTVVATGDALDGTASPDGVEMLSSLGQVLASGSSADAFTADTVVGPLLPPRPLRPARVDVQVFAAGLVMRASVGSVSVAGDDGGAAARFEADLEALLFAGVLD
jgi:hypothetical protein